MAQLALLAIIAQDPAPPRSSRLHRSNRRLPDLRGSRRRRVRLPRRRRSSVDGPGRCSLGFARWRSRPRGGMCGSARTRSATFRQPAWTRQAVANTATTICGASSRPTRSSSTWSRSPAPCRRCVSACWPRCALGATLTGRRVLACSVRLLDVGMFRIGSEVYEKEDGHLGLATIAKANVSIENGRAIFDYIAKEGVERVHAVADPCCVEIVGALKRRRGGGDHLLAFREGRAWHQVHAPLINAHLKSLIGDSFSAKNFRTWNGTLLAAVALARCERGLRQRARAAHGDSPGNDRRFRGARQHAGRRPRVLHRSPRVRPLPVWLDHRRRTAAHRGPGSRRRRSVEPPSSWPCSTCSRGSQRGHAPDELRPDGPRR